MEYQTPVRIPRTKIPVTSEIIHDVHKNYLYPAIKTTVTITVDVAHDGRVGCNQEPITRSFHLPYLQDTGQGWLKGTIGMEAPGNGLLV